MNSLTLKFCKAKSQLAWLCWLVIGMTVTPAAWSAPTVPAGFTIREVVTGLPNTLQDVAPGQGGAFGTDLYYISFPNQIMRVNPSGGTPTLFSTVNGTPSPKLTVLSFGFGGDLYAVDGNYQPGKVYRIQSDGTSSLFSNGVSTSSEGIAYSPGGDFGNNLYLSEFDNNPNPISSINSSGTVKLFTTLPNDSYRLTGLAFANGGGFGTSLYGVNQIGTIYKVASYGTNIAFPVNPPLQMNETLAFGRPNTLFGDNLFVTPDGHGNILKITPTGASSVFASSFKGFNSGGVTGLKLSQDNSTLFVTDDDAGIIYAIDDIFSIKLWDIYQGRDTKHGFSANLFMAKAGDINGDGIADVILGNAWYDCGYEQPVFVCVFVVFGPTSGLGPTLAELQALDGTKGFKIANVGPENSQYMDSVGDMNGDGIDDIIISDTMVDTYVVFGSKNRFSAVIDVKQLSGINGFKINRIPSLPSYGAVHGLGDINGDGVDDVAIENYDFGHVVFGQRGWSTPSINLDNLNGHGFSIQGNDRCHGVYLLLNAAGDIDGNGIKDLIVGTLTGNPECYSPGLKLSGYVVLGSSSLPSSVVVPNDFGHSVQGFTITAYDGGVYGKYTVSGDVDVNADGFDDVILNSYVIYGSQTPPSSIDVTNLNGANGFKITSSVGQFEVNKAGDVNGDGIGDLILGQHGEIDGSINPIVGASYVIFGNSHGFPATFDIANIGVNTGLIIKGFPFSEGYQPIYPYVKNQVRNVGDVNGDKLDDVSINPDIYDSTSGLGLIFYGTAPKLSALITGKTGTQNARVWTVTLSNSGGTALNAQINGLTLTQTFGAACTPVITSPASFPLALGNIAEGGSASGQITINFSGCSSTARFTAIIPFTVNNANAVISGSMKLNNQYR